MNHPAIYSALHRTLHWPVGDHVFDPPGAAPRVYSGLLERKLGEPLQLRQDAKGIRVGVLAGNPSSTQADPPIAIVCDFPRPIGPQTLRETHRLAWNFCKSPLLVTVEPHLLRVWSCFEKPDRDDPGFSRPPITAAPTDDGSVFDALVADLHWAQLVSGRFLREHADRFPREQRADRTLLENLAFVRRRLTSDLPVDIAHDLLARLIFVQYLFQRKDSRGRPALHEDKLADLHESGVLKAKYRRLSEILQCKADTYRLFEWLNTRFNGDLFPANLSREADCVHARTHLRMLSEFVKGDVVLANGQRCLWPEYSFDAIPLEFVSNIYEEFVKRQEAEEEGDDEPEEVVGQHYTRMHLVDFCLDRVLPWGGREYDLKVLDPSCGSAAFLVKVFQRLVHRWRLAHPGEQPPAPFLRGLLERSLFGVDMDKRAIRVASFSLYLAMCDEIDPRHYWTQTKFPPLREITLKAVDFFREDIAGIRTEEDANRYDLVVGNPPWGADSLTDAAREWAEDPDHTWPTADEQIGTLFLAKAAALTNERGTICMLQPAGALLFNVSPTAKTFREKFFDGFQVDEVFNLSALRFTKLFPEAVGPTCLVTFRPNAPSGEPIAYWSPKPTHTGEDSYRIVVEAHDLNWIYAEEAAKDPRAWSALTWGSRRDLEIVRRLGAKCGTLKKGVRKGQWHSDPGFKRVPKEAKPHPDRLGIPVLEQHDRWDSSPPVTQAGSFPENPNEYFERPRNLASYELPVLVMKAAWTVSSRRFRGVLVVPSPDESHLLYSQSFFGVHGPDQKWLAALAASVRSSLAVHYLYCTSGRLASYRPTLRKTDLDRMILPLSKDLTPRQLAAMGNEEIDRRTFDLYQVNEIDRALVQDFFEVTLPDFKGGGDSPGRQPAWRGPDPGSKRIFSDYCHFLIRVLKGGFGDGKPVCATVLAPSDASDVTFCVVALHLEWPGRGEIEFDPTEPRALRERLTHLDEVLSSQDPERGGVLYRRVARVYETLETRTAGGRTCRIPTVYFVKPNMLRYWTRSMALRDADEVAADILSWSQVDGG